MGTWRGERNEGCAVGVVTYHLRLTHLHTSRGLGEFIYILCFTLPDETQHPLYAQHFFLGTVLRCFTVAVDGGNTRGTGDLRKISCNRAVNAPSTPSPVSAEVSVNGMPNLLAFSLPCSVDTSRFASAWLPTKMKAGSCCVFSCTYKRA